MAIGFEVERGGQGFSTLTPQLGDKIKKIITVPKSRSSSRRSSRKTSPTVNYDPSKGTVLIDGVGYSVRPEDAASFIQSTTGGVGSSAQAAIKVAQGKVEAERRRIEKLAIELRKRDAELKPVRQEIIIERDLTPKNITLPPSSIKQTKDIPSYQGTIINLQESINKEKEMGKIGRSIITAANYLSGGAIEENKIQKKQAELNDRIIKFNKKYDGKELSESEFNKATAEQNFIEQEQRKINNQYDNLVKSKANKFRNRIQSLSIQKDPRLTTSEKRKIEEERKNNLKIQAQIKKNKPRIDKIESQIINKEKQLSSISSSKGTLNFIKKVKLQNQINELRNEIARLNFEMPPKIKAGTFPIIPASSIPQGISKVSFLGTQRKGKNGKIITDIIFTTKKGTTGIARGVAIQKKGKTLSVVAGKMGKIAIKIPSGKKKVINLKTFLGVERSTSKSTKFTSESIKKIASFIQKKKKAGTINIIKSNIKGLTQKGLGRIVTVKGKNFFSPVLRFPSGKIVRTANKYNLDDFASIAAVLTKNQISAIVGKTITLKGNRAEFAGIIKSLSGTAGSKVVLSSSDKAQYSKAMRKLFTSIAAAVSKAERSGQFTTKSLVLAAAAKELSKIKPVSATSVSASTRVSTKLKKPIVSKTKMITPKIKQTESNKRGIVSTRSKIKTLQKEIVESQIKSKQLQRNLSKTSSRSKSILISRELNSVRQKQRQLQRQLQRLKNRLKTEIKTQTPSITPKVSLGNLMISKLPNLPKGFSKLILKKSQPVYYVIEKVRGKFKKLYPKPLTKKDARDYAVYSIDNRLSKTAFFVPLGKAKTVARPPKQIQGYYSKNAKKFRPYRIRFGKKKQLVNGFIEKRKYFQDTSGEKRSLRMLRKSPTKRKVVKRKISPTQRRELLKRLAKARAVRMRNLRKKK
jgi:hypothetical protein